MGDLSDYCTHIIIFLLVSCPTRLSSSWWWRPQIAPFENCSIWELLHLRNAPFEKCSIWELLHLRNAPFEKCSIWEMLHLRIASFEKCSIWEMLHLRNALFENCWIWETPNLRNVRMKTNHTFWEGCNFNQDGLFNLIKTVTCTEKSNVPGNTQRVNDRCTRLGSN